MFCKALSGRPKVYDRNAHNFTVMLQIVPSGRPEVHDRNTHKFYIDAISHLDCPRIEFFAASQRHANAFTFWHSNGLLLGAPTEKCLTPDHARSKSKEEASRHQPPLILQKYSPEHSFAKVGEGSRHTNCRSRKNIAK